MENNFFSQVYKLVEQIPRGRVATYGQIAALISTPRAARAVGWALRALPADTTLPWQRVVGAKGFLTITNPLFPAGHQAKALEKDGVTVTKTDDSYVVDLDRYLWTSQVSPRP